MKLEGALLSLTFWMVLLASASAAQTQEPPKIDARIVALNCAAELATMGSSRPVALRSSRDVGRALSEGDQIRCIGDGYLELFVCEEKKRVNSSQGWFPIPPLPAKPPFCRIGEALRKYGVPGGTRAGGSLILWPYDGSTVNPETFVIRWVPVQEKIELAIRVAGKNVTVWGPVKEDGTIGLLKPDSISAILMAYRSQSEQSDLILSLSLREGTKWEDAHFSVLTSQQEHDLTAELSSWATWANAVALHLGRAYSFTHFRLFVEAADEYDSALRGAPESPYLLEEAIEMNRLAGKNDRVQELQRLLKALE
jgi:hypothetical protein